jgi:hypothetical protein
MDGRERLEEMARAKSNQQQDGKEDRERDEISPRYCVRRVTS